MLDNLKQMQEQGIFKILPNDIELNKIIEEATCIDDIGNYIENIKVYIKDVINELENRYSVNLGTTISDFYDKFNYELFDMYLETIDVKSRVYTKEVTYGKAGNVRIGMRASDIKFTLEERKLMKIINHHYISLKADSSYDNEDFFIPYEQLKMMFSNGKNHQAIKEEVIETCDRISNKEIFWDFTTTRYVKTKNLKDLKLASCKGDNLVDIAIIYQPRTEKTATVKGIICRVNKFMKLRYMLKQISNYFPTKCLQGGYLEFVIADRLLYHMKLQRNKNLSYKIELSKLAKQIYAYKDGEQLSENFMRTMYHDDHKPIQQLYFLRAISKVAEDYATNKNNFHCELNLIIDNGLCIPLLKDLEYSRNEQHILNEIKISVNGKKQLQSILNELDTFRKNSHSIHNDVYNKIFKLKCLNKVIVQKYLDLILCGNTIDIEQFSDELVKSIKVIKMSMYEMMKKGRIQLIVTNIK